MRKVMLLVFVATLAGCESVESEDVLTSGMYADLSVTATGDGTSLAVTKLKVGGAGSNTYVELTGDDQLTVTLGEETKTMTPQVLGDYHQYVATFDSDEPNKTYTVSFLRSVDEGAPESTMELPEPFEIEAAPESYQRSANITLTWTPSGSSDNMEITATGDCIVSYHREISGDPGTFTIEAGSLAPLDEEAQASCDVTYTIERWRAGTVDPGYGEGGKAAGHQVRSISVNTQP